MKTPELHLKKSSCSYCGDAPISHARSFFESLVFITVDSQAKKIIKYVPSFLKRFVDWILELFFRTLVFLGLARFSADIERASSLRSKIIWEEAKRRGIEMEQIIFLGKPLDHYRAALNIKGRRKKFYFESIPIRPEFLDMDQNWDNKSVLKREFRKNNIPIPEYVNLNFFNFQGPEKAFYKLRKPIIVKPRMGSRGRHT